MEDAAGGRGWDLNSLVAVLTQGEAQLRQLCECMAARSPAEQEKQLVQRAQSCFQTAICMAKAAESDLFQAAAAAAAAADSPRSNSGCSANSERALKEQQRKEMCKKRKTLRKWTSRVRVLGSSDGHDDGFNWRKYGKKDILGAKYPRAYFRCTFRNAAGCPAIKQVQRSDDDPFVIDVTYRGDHTCLQSKKSQPGAGAPPALSSEPAEQKQQLLHCLQTSLKVETEGFSSDDQNHNCFSFASTPASGGVSPPFVSPTTAPESSNFWLSSDFGDLFSAVTPANDYSSYVDFMLDSAGFAAASPFDASAFFHDSEI